MTNTNTNTSALESECMKQLRASCLSILEDLEKGEEVEALDITYCKNTDKDGADYCCILFGCGGPHIEAVREPDQAHFHIRGYWGSDSCELVDWTDLIPNAFCVDCYADSFECRAV